ncbi:uncharacterized protein LOC128992621 isoform X2 [Macrosteles quadrilineatus]|uniref:uncharacterized protein LOC128992621 isoform X2 n=1 Tax=Macrosteles quadrilineatus TaxID=74068 RepID=UPI0023E24EF9|nr:uncharacterized protein LOC128992621 isoform X2 [Macrosteles quadrilineatus]
MRRLLDCLLLLVVVAVVNCQFSDDYGPAPPRLLIPGAVPLGPAPSAPRRPVARLQARRQQLAPQVEATPAPPLRLRSRPSNGRAGRLPPQPSPQPTLASTPPPQQFFSPTFTTLQQRPQSFSPQEDAPIRPVIEETEDDYEEEVNNFSAAPNPTTPPPPPPPPPAPQRPAFRPERPALLPTPAPELNFVSPPRQQPRPAPSILPDDDESLRQYSRNQYTSRTKARPTPVAEEQQFNRQYNRAQSVVRAPQKPLYTSPAKQDYEKPNKAQRPRKPVAQVLRRYREENEDGSITWGYENDDGSFKEETIGTDCVTYGKYGYIDPDGTRREYTYSTGIPCDREKEKDSQNQASEGYIDYAENKYVLPSGETIDLNKMVKNRARKPVQNTQYRN